LLAAFPSLTEFEHNCLIALVKEYGGKRIASLARALQADIDADKADIGEDKA